MVTTSVLSLHTDLCFFFSHIEHGNKMTGHELTDKEKMNDVYNEGVRAMKHGRWKLTKTAFLHYLASIEEGPVGPCAENVLQIAQQLEEAGKFFCKILSYKEAIRTFDTAFLVLSASKKANSRRLYNNFEDSEVDIEENTDSEEDEVLWSETNTTKKKNHIEDTKKPHPEITHVNNCMSEMRIDDEVLNSLERRMASIFKREMNCVLQTGNVNELASLATKRLGHFRKNVADAAVCATLGNIFLEIGEAQVDSFRVSSATDTLEKSSKYFKRMGVQWTNADSVPIAKLLGTLGYCYMYTGTKVGTQCLKLANSIWQRLRWPVEEAHAVLSAMKHSVESELKTSKNPDDREACSNMMKFYVKLKPMHQELKVADAFVHLGAAAFQNSHEKRAVGYFEQALWIYKQRASPDTNRNDIVKVLRFIGISSYNCRNFEKAAKAYTECLAIIQKTDGMSTTKMNQLAECYASLGFTFSRLRDFDQMLHFYEMALELQKNLAAEDLELIQTNVGSLYFVKAVKAEKSGDVESADVFFQKAEASFNRAQRYSWKSFPFINFGYYLLCRERYTEAVQILSQGYHNGQVDKDTVEFDHTEDPILIEDLQFELEEREDIRMPSAILALYLQTLAHTRMVDDETARQCVERLNKEITSCKYEAYYVEGFGVERMKALCYSLLGYAYRHLGCHSQALEAFNSAACLLPSYTAANRNVESQKGFLASRQLDKTPNAITG